MANKLRTRKSIEKRIAELGGTSSNKPEALRLAKKFNDIVVREKVKKHGICSLNPNDPSDKRFLSRNKLIKNKYNNRC